MAIISDVMLAKLVSVTIIFFGSLLFGLLPAFRVFSKFPRFVLSLILSYGGGILIATSLVHILPEANEAWPSPAVFTAEMTLCLGIFLVYVVEEVAHFLVCHDIHSPLTHAGEHGERKGHNHGVHVHHDNPPHRCDEPAAVFLLTDERARNNQAEQCEAGNNDKHHHHGHNHNHEDETCPLSPDHEHGHGDHSNNHNNHAKEKDALDDHAVVKLFPKSINETKSDKPEKEKLKSLAGRLRSLVGLVALSVHAGLEGLSVGLGRDASDVWYLCGAVAAHKLVIAFCLGMEVRMASSKNECTNVQTSSSPSFKFRYVLFFASMTPLGIAIGTLITELVQEPNQKTESITVAVLQALAAGTLLYVAFFEVILRERAKFAGKGLYQLILVILGWATMVTVEIIMKDYHSHGHGASDYDDHGHSHDHAHDHDR